MMREKLTPAIIAKRSAVAMAGLVLAATINVASASTSTGSSSASVRFAAQQPVRLAETITVTKPKHVKRISRPHKAERGPGTTWLNPQPEPPIGQVNRGNTWLNPQPEPPRPDTRTKNLH